MMTNSNHFSKREPLLFSSWFKKRKCIYTLQECVNCIAFTMFILCDKNIKCGSHKIQRVIKCYHVVDPGKKIWAKDHLFNKQNYLVLPAVEAISLLLSRGNREINHLYVLNNFISPTIYKKRLIGLHNLIFLSYSFISLISSLY